MTDIQHRRNGDVLGESQIRPLEYTRTEHQIRPFTGFKPEEIRHRETSWGLEDAPRTHLLAAPPAWMQRDDLPCLDDWELYDDRKRESEAAEGCQECPVRQACLSEALSEEASLTAQHRYLVRGGKTPDERATLALP